jgi:choline dehydrogenase
MRDGVRRLYQLGTHPAFQSICHEIQIANTGLPLAELASASDARIDHWLLTECNDAQHGAGGCCIGPRGSTHAVVDPECRVHGVKGLRVVDASVMPRDCRANTALTTIMIGEKIADLLRTRACSG